MDGFLDCVLHALLINILDITTGSAHAEIVRHASRWTHTNKVQNTFFHTHWSSTVELGITGYYCPSGLHLGGSQNTDISCHCQFPLFVALCVYNPPTLQRDRHADMLKA